MNTTSEGSSRFPERDHGEVLAELLNVPDKFILDIGCGSGRLTRIMEKMGASVVGIDPGAKQLERARSQSVTGSDFYVKATAENLPVNNNSVHIAVFFNSLHHIPISFMGNALSEAYRVLKNGGVLYVAEPLAEGPLFELSKPFNNETKVREKAYEIIKGASDYGFLIQKEYFYSANNFYTDFDSYRENSISVNPKRDDYFRKMGDKMRARFERYGVRGEKGWCFTQSIRVNILKHR